MSKTLLSLMAAVLVCIAATSAQADQVISSSTLEAMGLSGLTAMSDSDGMSIRGMGFGGHKKKSKKPWARANGESWAVVELDGKKKEAEAGSENSYAAEGKYEASGENGSEAEMKKSHTLRVDYSDGTFSIEKRTFKIEVEAGGYSRSKAF